MDIKKTLTTKTPRDETVDETVERYMWLYEGGDKPKNYDDPSIRKIDKMDRLPIVNRKIEQKLSGNKTLNYINKNINQYENKNIKMLPTGAKLTQKDQPKKFRVAPPKQFSHHDPDTYLSSGKPQAQLSTWELLKQTAKTPQEKKEIRDTIRSSYKNNKSFIPPDELRMIGKHPDQLKALETPEVKPILNIDLPTPRVTPLTTPEVTPSVYRSIPNTKTEPGISQELLGLQKQIKRNVDYVLGTEDQKDESRNKETITEEENLD